MATENFIIGSRHILGDFSLGDDIVSTVMSFLALKEPLLKCLRYRDVCSFNSDWIELTEPKRNKRDNINAFMSISGKLLMFECYTASFSLDVNRNCMLLDITTDIIKNFVKFDEKMINYGHMYSELIFGEVKTRKFIEKAYVKSVRNNDGVHYIDLKTEKGTIEFLENNSHYSVALPFQEFMDKYEDKKVIVCFKPRMWFQNKIFGIHMALNLVKLSL
jgi:hypothetical protein